jgi:hypothetical protein
MISEVSIRQGDFDVEKLGLPRVLEVLYTCDWTSPTAEDSESIDSFQEGEIDFELNAFDDDKQDGSERDVEYMERMMAMLINARGKTQKGFSNFRNGSGDEFRGTETISATYGGNSSENVLIPGVCSF